MESKTSVEKFKEFSELEAYSKAQGRTIVELSRKLNERDSEIIHLKKLLEGSVPLIKPEAKVMNLGSNDQEYICRTEINKLRDISIERELSLEECKKLDIYSKILKELANAPKTIEIQAKQISTEELMAAISSDKE